MSYLDNSKYLGTTVNGCKIIGYDNPSKRYLLKCLRCGTEFTKNRSTVDLQKVKCECSKKRQTRHTDGYCNTKIKSIYLNIIDRCCNKNCHAYADYGGRGIKICDVWLNDFREFYKWAMSNGYNEGLTIDRIDNNGNYEPTNCRFVTRSIQCNNRRSNALVKYNGKIYTIAQLSRVLGIKYSTLYSQIRRGKYECVRNK